MLFSGLFSLACSACLGIQPRTCGCHCPPRLGLSHNSQENTPQTGALVAAVLLMSFLLSDDSRL